MPAAPGQAAATPPLRPSADDEQHAQHQKVHLSFRQFVRFVGPGLLMSIAYVVS
jgi:hypothetical protein